MPEMWIIDVHTNRDRALERLRDMKFNGSPDEKPAWEAARAECILRVEALPDGSTTHVRAEPDFILVKA